jgi:hypothetical protein
MNEEQAFDAVLDLAKAKWDANSPALNGGTAPPVEWPFVPIDAPLREQGGPWMRVTIRSQTPVGRPTLGRRGAEQVRFPRAGRFSAQIFVPSRKRGLVSAQRLAKVLVDAFEDQQTAAGGVSFNSVLSTEAGEDDTWYQVNVSAIFHYDEVK